MVDYNYFTHHYYCYMNKINLLLEYVNHFFTNYIFNFLSLSHFYFLFLFYLHVILSIWSRATGPRFRLDQINKITWKQFIIILFMYIVIIIVLFFI